MDQIISQRVKIIISNIRKVREYRNYSQEYVAMKLSISQNAYSKIEVFQSKITLNRLFNIAIILNVKVKQLITIDHFTSEMLEALPPIKN
ncbi:helix-turn-helix transcriptional regulator [Pedobacter sp. MC2016-15]|uniref:helix-turn-helix domain-containing protein n=1 Tax=Pedobacter sp. MC2016-15 TaxID=2994473 RepID=UPI002247EA32|nr:helix-turn-helix transcriptional regulator [Pedobacter sp. MC2016-15]MCX2481598.1 helix-turn-helix transcriptional regulator [Pedobacter sp. MC2016-15]